MSNPWFRWYSGTTTDPKLALIAHKAEQPRTAVIAVWAALLEHASQADERGDISRFDPETLAIALDLNEDAIHAIISAMVAKGMIEGQRIAAWGKRQPQREDGAAERAKAWREQQKQQTTNATERNRTQPNAGKRPEERREEEIREDTDKPPEERAVGDSPRANPKPNGGSRPRSRKAVEIFPDCPDWLPPERWQEYLDHRRTQRKPLTPAAARIILQDLEKARSFGHDPAELIRESIGAGWQRCVFPDRHFQPAARAPTATGAPDGRRKGQTMIEHMMESHARMDALLDAKDAENRTAHALSAETAPLEDVPYVRH